MYKPEKIRNIAIVAHIDHGKTTLLDTLLKQSKVFRENESVPERVMDSYDQEKERGITIFSKHSSISYDGYKINVIDTPGHADFSGEVERVLGMVNSVLLLIDAQEGPMPQTRFVLAKSLQMGLRPIVIVNKIDRPHANPDRALDLTFDLFSELGATDEQLDFTYCYASGFNGYAIRDINDERKNLDPLLDTVIENCPAPSGDLENPFLMQAATMHYDEYVGRQGCGRILEGQVYKGQSVVRVDRSGNKHRGTITRIEAYEGINRVELERAGVGDIVTIAGFPDIMIGDSICDVNHPVELPPIPIDEPTVSVNIMVNNSPFAGKEGKHVTMNKLRDRLEKEKRANISLRIEEIEGSQDAVKVSGRGELHLAVLVEAMRREGYELSMSKPQVIVKQIDGVKNEPIESVHIEVPEEYSGAVIEELSKRKGEMQSLSTNEHNITSMEFLVPTRGLMGYRRDFVTLTRGLGILTSILDSFQPWKGTIPSRNRGALVSGVSGKTNAYACFNLQSRGTLFVDPTDEVYEGMVVGENSRDNDLVVNVTKAKQLTNVRASGTDDAIVLIPPRKHTLETALEWIEDDELIEVTPNSIRLRKRLLKEFERKRQGRV
ncbi:MAG: translational GTPase TypA [Waddliaceae bacterium]|nr:translational GTPase TypA [Waddliaceae bacterium]